MPVTTTYRGTNGAFVPIGSTPNSEPDFSLKAGQYIRIKYMGFINNPLLNPNHPEYNANIDLKDSMAYNTITKFKDLASLQDKIEVIRNVENLNNLDTTSEIIFKAKVNLTNTDLKFDFYIASPNFHQDRFDYTDGGRRPDTLLEITKFNINEGSKINILLTTSYEQDSDAASDIFSQAKMKADGGSFLGNFGDRLVDGKNDNQEQPETNYDTKNRQDKDLISVDLEAGKKYTFTLSNESSFLTDAEFFAKAHFSLLVYKKDGTLLEKEAITLKDNKLTIEAYEDGEYFIAVSAKIDSYITEINESNISDFSDDYFGPISYKITSSSASILDAEGNPYKLDKFGSEIKTSTSEPVVFAKVNGENNRGTIDFFGDKDVFTFTITKSGVYSIDFTDDSESYSNIIGVLGKFDRGSDGLSLMSSRDQKYQLAAGDYKVVFEGFSKGNDYNFKIKQTEIDSSSFVKDITKSKSITSQFSENSRTSFIKIKVEEGETYLFTISSAKPFSDLDLRILGVYDTTKSSDSVYQLYDDDSEGNNNSRIFLRADDTSNLYVKVAASNNYHHQQFIAKIEKTKVNEDAFAKYQDQVKDTPFFLTNAQLKAQEAKYDVSEQKYSDLTNPLKLDFINAADRKIIEIDLQSGNWIFETYGDDNNFSIDTIIYGIYDSSGKYISGTYDDNSGYNDFSKVAFSTNSVGKFYIHIGSRVDSNTEFNLKVVRDEPSTQSQTPSDVFRIDETEINSPNPYQKLIISPFLNDGSLYKITISSYNENGNGLENPTILGLYFGEDLNSITYIPFSISSLNHKTGSVEAYFTATSILPYKNSIGDSADYFSTNKLFINVGSTVRNIGEFKATLEELTNAPFKANSFSDSINGLVKDSVNFHGIQIDFLPPTLVNYGEAKFEHWKKFIADSIERMWESKTGRAELEFLAQTSKKISFVDTGDKDQAYFSGEISINYNTIVGGFFYSSRDSEHQINTAKYDLNVVNRVIIHELMHVIREWPDPVPGQYNNHLEVTNRIIREINGEDPSLASGYDRIAYPIILDLNLNGNIDLISKEESSISFDMNSDGKADITGWTKPVAGIADGILFQDINQNDKVDNIMEMSFSRFSESKTSDLLGLKSFDKNHDLKIDKNDEIYLKLKVWQDNNHNGISERDEIFSLAELNIKSINLQYRELDYLNDISKNQVTKESSLTKSDKQEVKIWDVGFSYFE